MKVRIVSKLRSACGFTLIEVLVALMILSLSLAIIFSIFSVGLRGRRAAEEYEQATLLAEVKTEFDWCRRTNTGRRGCGALQ